MEPVGLATTTPVGAVRPEVLTVHTDADANHSGHARLVDGNIVQRHLFTPYSTLITDNAGLQRQPAFEHIAPAYHRIERR